MEFNLISIWSGKFSGFSILEIDSEHGEIAFRSLFGICYDKDERFIGIDVFWMYFEIKLKDNG